MRYDTYLTRRSLVAGREPFAGKEFKNRFALVQAIIAGARPDLSQESGFRGSGGSGGGSDGGGSDGGGCGGSDGGGSSSSGGSGSGGRGGRHSSSNEGLDSETTSSSSADPMYTDPIYTDPTSLASAELTSLITRCWEQDPESRPGFGEIVELLAQLPEIAQVDDGVL